MADALSHHLQLWSDPQFSGINAKWLTILDTPALGVCDLIIISSNSPPRYDSQRVYNRTVEAAPPATASMHPLFQPLTHTLMLPVQVGGHPPPGGPAQLVQSELKAILDRLNAIEKAIGSGGTDDNSETRGRTLVAGLKGVEAMARELFGTAEAVITADDDAEPQWVMRVTARPVSTTDLTESRNQWFNRLASEFPQLMPGEVMLELEPAE